jgi:hypothetical protein
MPAVSVADLLLLPRLSALDPVATRFRPVRRLVTAPVRVVPLEPPAAESADDDASERRRSIRLRTRCLTCDHLLDPSQRRHSGRETAGCDGFQCHSTKFIDSHAMVQRLADVGAHCPLRRSADRDGELDESIGALVERRPFPDHSGEGTLCLRHVREALLEFNVDLWEVVSHTSRAPFEYPSVQAGRLQSTEKSVNRWAMSPPAINIRVLERVGTSIKVRVFPR